MATAIQIVPAAQPSKPAKRSTRSARQAEPMVLDRFTEDAIEITVRVPGSDTLSVRWDLAFVDNDRDNPDESFYIGGDVFRDIATGSHGALFELGPHRGQTAEDTLRALAVLCTDLADRLAARRTT